MVEIKQIAVTGGAGFIGSNLVLALQEKYPLAMITVVDDFRSGSFKNLEGFKGDLVTGDISQLDLKKYFRGRKVDVLFHLASITDTTEHDQFKQNYDNIEGWRNLLDYFGGKKTRIMFASSAATYGVGAGINTLESPQKPANVYAFSKVQLENLARIFAQEYPKQVVVGLRYFNVYGPREAHKKAAASMLLQLAQQMKAGQKPRIFKMGEQKRDFVYVKDIVRYTLAAGLQATRSGVYNAGSGAARSFNDVIANLNRVLGLAVETEYIDNPYSFYQPHTEADQTQTIKMLRLKALYDLEKGIEDYYKSGFLV
jgi:ADP-L-glycero-D-manno-heptose 6-epimerase